MSPLGLASSSVRELARGMTHTPLKNGMEIQLLFHLVFWKLLENVQ